MHYEDADELIQPDNRTPAQRWLDAEIERRHGNEQGHEAAIYEITLDLRQELEDAQGEIRALRATEAGLRDRLAAVEADRDQRVPDVDALSNFIREIDGAHRFGAGALAERICEWLASTPAPAQQEPNWWRKRADEIELAVARSGSTDAMRCYTDMRTLLQAATAAPAPAQQEPGTPMDAHRAAYFMRRFLHEEKMLGPNEQAALHFTIAALEAMESAQHQEHPQQERKPMTPEQVAETVFEVNGNEPSALFWRDLVSAVERHHGIKE